MRSVSVEKGADDLGGMTEGERLILRLLRRWVQCLRQPTGYALAVMEGDLQDALGRRDAEAAMPALMRLTHILWAYARMPMGIHWPCCSQVSGDERNVVAVIAACQASDYLAARDIATAALQVDGIPECLQAATRIAVLFTRNGIFLPYPGRVPQKERPGDAPHRPASLTIN